jgi:hypothetical protein
MIRWQKRSWLCGNYRPRLALYVDINPVDHYRRGLQPRTSLNHPPGSRPVCLALNARAARVLQAGLAIQAREHALVWQHLN